MGRRYGDIDITVEFDNGWYATTRVRAIEDYDPGDYWNPPYSEFDYDLLEITDIVVLYNEELDLEFSDNYKNYHEYKDSPNSKINWDRVYKEISKRNFQEGDDFQEDDPPEPDYDDIGD